MRGIKTGFGLTLALAIAGTCPAYAQSVEGLTPTPNITEYAAPISESIPASVAAPSQDYCITMMAGFPNESHVPRYQFFRLTEELTRDVTPEFQSVITAYSDKDIPENTPILDIIEAIANPVLRQAAPEIVTSYMGQIIQFSQVCAPFISGQVNSLRAYDNALADNDNIIHEDALYLRQILLDSLSRQGADQNPVFMGAIENYQRALVGTRDNIEYAAFVDEIDGLEALYMEDLDGRLARSNDIINEEINRETLGDAVNLSDDMNEDLKRKGDQETISTLVEILNGLL